MIQSMMSRHSDRLTQRAGESHREQRLASSRERVTILVVEDDTSIAELLAQVLDEAGYEVLTAANGRAGLTMSQALRPELVLTDYTMPVLDGAQHSGSADERHATQ